MKKGKFNKFVAIVLCLLVVTICIPSAAFAYDYGVFTVDAGSLNGYMYQGETDASVTLPIYVMWAINLAPTNYHIEVLWDGYLPGTGPKGITVSDYPIPYPSEGINIYEWYEYSPLIIWGDGTQEAGTYKFSLVAVDWRFPPAMPVPGPETTLTVEAPDNPPAANDKTDLSTYEDTQLSITLTGSDPDAGDTLENYDIVTWPSHGSLNGMPPNLTYTPDTDYVGPDSFQFRLTDNHHLYSNVATVIINVIGDADGDGIADDVDNAPNNYNPDQSDRDGDGIGDVADNAPDIPNPDQADRDGDGVGDVADNAPDIPNPDQADRDGDSVGDVADNAPDNYNPGQEDTDCDGVADVIDNAPNNYNPGQEDTDSDGVADVIDNAPDIPNPDQADRDGDGVGDVADNAPDVANPDQDSSIDGVMEVFNNAVSGGSLNGNGIPANQKLDAFYEKLEEIKLLIEFGNYNTAIHELEALIKFVDGEPSPKDLVTGIAADDIESMINNLIENLKSLI